MSPTDIFGDNPALAPFAQGGAAVIAVSPDGTRLVGGTATGCFAFQAASGALPRTLVEQLARLASQVTFSAPRLVRLRLGGLRPVTVKAQRARLADGAGVLVLVALDAPAMRHGAEPAPVAPPLPTPAEATPPEMEAALHDTADHDIADVADAGGAPSDVDTASGSAAPEPALPEPEPEPEPAGSSVPTAEAATSPDPVDEVIPAPAAMPEAEAEAVETTPPAALREETPAARPLRFVWQADEHGVLGLVSPEFAARVDREAGSLVGRRWIDLAAELGFDPDGALGRVLERRDTWSGITIDWPLADGRMLPVDLAGLPVFDRDKTFRGFRGFGVCRAPQMPAPPAAGDRATPGAAEPSSPPAAAPNPATVVRFPEPRPPLSTNERQAFREIARALGRNAPDKAVVEPARKRPMLVTPPPAAPAAPIASAPAPAAVARIAAPVQPAAPAPASAAPADDHAAVLDALPLAVLVHRGGVPIFTNKCFADLTGYDDLDAFAHAGVDALFMADEDGAPDGMVLRHAQGHPLPVEGRMKQVSWQGAPATLLAFRASPPKVETAGTVDAERTQALERQVRELNAILDTATDGVVVLDAEGRILSINRSAEALFGYESAELAGRSLTLLFSTESHTAALDYLDGLKANGVALLLNDGREVMGVARRGGSIPLFMTLGRLDDADGVTFCAVLRDITQFKKAEAELKAAKTHAETISAQKSDFLARVSHEVRTPLNAILGFAEVMMEERFGPIGTERYRDYLRDIHISGQHVISLVNDLLDLSKIEAGRLDLAFTSLQLNDVVTTAVGLMQPQANTSRVIVRTSLAAKLPAVVADERSVRQIALNLLSNAIKFTPPGGQVIISTALTDLGQAVIRVRDTGIGMTDKDIQSALEPFRQIASSGRGDGTGLGLPLTKALTEANRATFAIQSAAGSGTLVEVIFPPTRVLAE